MGLLEVVVPLVVAHMVIRDNGNLGYHIPLELVEVALVVHMELVVEHMVLEEVPLVVELRIHIPLGLVVVALVVHMEQLAEEHRMVLLVVALVVA